MIFGPRAWALGVCPGRPGPGPALNVGMHPSNISRIVNVMNHGEGCEEVSPQQVIDFIRQRRNNTGQKFIFIIKYFQEKAESDLEFFFANGVDHAGTLSISWG